MPTGNNTCTIVVWLCGKINTCTNMFIHSFLCVHVCNLHNYDVTTGGNIGLVLPVGTENFRLTSKIYPILFLCHPIPHSTIRRIIFNPRRACAARVTVVVLCVCVCCPGRSSATQATKRQPRHTHRLSILLVPE